MAAVRSASLTGRRPAPRCRGGTDAAKAVLSVDEVSHDGGCDPVHTQAAWHGEGIILATVLELFDASLGVGTDLAELAR